MVYFTQRFISYVDLFHAETLPTAAGKGAKVAEIRAKSAKQSEVIQQLAYIVIIQIFLPYSNFFPPFLNAFLINVGLQPINVKHYVRRIKQYSIASGRVHAKSDQSPGKRTGESKSRKGESKSGRGDRS